jgi:uncharacterized membrane protein YcaP (DUF421 family)
MTLDDVLGTTNHLDWTQECARAVVIFVYGLIAVRLAGRRTFAKWSALDLIVSIVAGSNLSRALTGQAPFWGTLAATTLLMALHWVLARLAARSARMSRLLEGRSIPLGQSGRLEQRALARHAVSEADLNEALRVSGLASASDARLVTLEPSGKISVLRAR